MPYRLSGGTLIYTAYGDAYIEPINAPNEYIDSNVSFDRNLSGLLEWPNVVGSNKDLESADDFWVAYLLAAWQGAVSEDFDPSTGNALATKGEARDLGNMGAIYVETLREDELRSDKPRTEEEHTVVHEIGHKGGGDHADGGIMTEGSSSMFHIPPPSRPNDKFMPVTIRRFRIDKSF